MDRPSVISSVISHHFQYQHQQFKHEQLKREKFNQKQLGQIAHLAMKHGFDFFNSDSLFKYY